MLYDLKFLKNSLHLHYLLALSPANISGPFGTHKQSLRKAIVSTILNFLGQYCWYKGKQ